MIRTCLGGWLALTVALSAVSAAAAGPPLEANRLSAALSREFGGQWEAQVWGKTSWARGTIATTAQIATSEDARRHASAIVAAVAPFLGLAGGDLAPAGVGETDCQFGVTFAQAMDGIPVEGGRLDVTFLKRTGGQVSLSGTLYSGIVVPVLPAVPAEEAGKSAWIDYRENFLQYDHTYATWEQIPAEEKVLQDSRLVVVPATGSEAKDRLAWRLSFGRIVYRVDATTGAVIDAFRATRPRP